MDLVVIISSNGDLNDPITSAIIHFIPLPSPRSLDSFSRCCTNLIIFQVGAAAIGYFVSVSDIPLPVEIMGGSIVICGAFIVTKASNVVLTKTSRSYGVLREYSAVLRDESSFNAVNV